MDFFKMLIKTVVISFLIVGCSTYGLVLNDFENFRFLKNDKNQIVLGD